MQPEHQVLIVLLWSEDPVTSFPAVVLVSLLFSEPDQYLGQLRGEYHCIGNATAGAMDI